MRCQVAPSLVDIISAEPLALGSLWKTPRTAPSFGQTFQSCVGEPLFLCSLPKNHAGAITRSPFSLCLSSRSFCVTTLNGEVAGSNPARLNTAGSSAGRAPKPQRLYLVRQVFLTRCWGEPTSLCSQGLGVAGSNPVWLLRRPVAQPGRALEKNAAASTRSPRFSDVAQLEEHAAVNRGVAGSSPAIGARLPFPSSRSCSVTPTGAPVRFRPAVSAVAPGKSSSPRFGGRNALQHLSFDGLSFATSRTPFVISCLGGCPPMRSCAEDPRRALTSFVAFSRQGPRTRQCVTP